MNFQAIKELLDEKSALYNQPTFIENDPVSIPHQYTKKQDIEISGFFAATLAWGHRKTIINKCKVLFRLMDDAPHDFMVNHREADLKHFLHFKHRTFNTTDLLYFISFFQSYYQKNQSLESAFMAKPIGTDLVQTGLTAFHKCFFSLVDFPLRTKKHVSTPAKNSACKRLNMFLRWMVRKDDKGVDFGIWAQLQPKDLICPLDVHVDRIARRLNLVTRKQTDWKTAVELTNSLRKFDAVDPVKYDFALFGMGVMEKR